jgi:acetyl esterase/lipase
MTLKTTLALALAALCLAAHPASAQTRVIPTPTDLKIIPLMAEGSPASEQWEDVSGWRRARNVTQAALYPVLPKAGTANGAAVIIAPGGGFQLLSMDSEGFRVAEFLAERGVTAFVLKYRLAQMPPAAVPAAPALTNPSPTTAQATLLAQADGLAAMKWVRAHAADYGLKTDKIGFMGFSAGGTTTTNVVLNADKDSRPDFVGVVYGGITPGATVPADAPPVFIMVAADDRTMGDRALPIYQAWRAAGRSAELHIYARGAHGFGMRTQGTSSDHWAEDFYAWMKAEVLK